jgi:cation-transporting ATPase E
MAINKKEELLKAIEDAEKMDADFLVGLSEEQVKKRMDAGLSNKVPKKVTKTYWQILADNLLSFFNILLFSIAVLMMIAKLEPTSFFFVLILAANIFIGLLTDIRARRMVDKLRVITDPKVTVVRGGKEVSLQVSEVVLSDIVILRPGDQICAGAIVVNGALNVDESLLTGESDSIHKEPGDEVLSGSYVRSGTAYARVCRIGITNFAEGLQDSAKKFNRPKSEIKKSCVGIFWVTGIIAIVVGLGMLVVDITTLIKTNTPVSMDTYTPFIRSLSGSLVAMIPSGLYLLSSMTLGTGVINLAKKHMNVQELYCIENLARVDTICFDKTGTLTDGVLTIKEIYNYSNLDDLALSGKISSLLAATKDNNPTATALKKRFNNPTMEPTAAIPFDSVRKLSAASFEDGTYILGAPSFIDSVANPSADKQIHYWAARGLRVVGFFYNKQPIKGGDIPAKSTLICLIAFSDHVKPDAKKNIQWFRNNGVDIKIISGDDALTVSQIAQEVGVPGAAYYVSMEKVKDEQIPELVQTYSVFGRVRPEQKALLIEALQKQGHKVAMTGDGVNDIIALKTADCSIAMASGSSAARNVSHIVSMDNDFSKLPDVVAEGRRVINNLERTASLFLVKTFFAITVSVAFLIAKSIGVSEGYPFTTNNMMVWEIVTIGAGGFFLALQPSKEKIRGGFLETILAKAVPAGVAQSASVLIFFLYSYLHPGFIDRPTLITLSVLTFTLTSYLVLLRVCWPFDQYRGTVFTGMSLLGLIFFVLDLSLPSTTKRNGPTSRVTSALFDLSYQAGTNVNQIVLMLIVLFSVSVLYFVADFIVSSVLRRKYPAQRGVTA